MAHEKKEKGMYNQGRKNTGTIAAKFRPERGCRYIAFFKPYGVLSQFTTQITADAKSVSPDSARLPHATLADFGFPPDVYAVGRLDADSEGLLVLSDDPRLNAMLLSSVYGHSRHYLTQIEGIPSQDALDALRKGVVVQGKMTLPARATLMENPPNHIPPRSVPIRYRATIPTSWIMLELVEGRNRQVRRMTAAVGHPTLRLVRWAIGGLDLARLGLAPGEWRDLDTTEILML